MGKGKGKMLMIMNETAMGKGHGKETESESEMMVGGIEAMLDNDGGGIMAGGKMGKGKGTIISNFATTSARSASEEARRA